MRWTRIVSVAVTSLLVVVALGCQQPAAPAAGGQSGPSKEAVKLRFSAGSMGSSGYTWGAAASALLKKHANIEVSVRSGETTQNALLLEKGEVDMGSTNGVSLFEVYADKVDQTRIRILTAMFPVSWLLIVKKDNPANSLADLKGKRISVGVGGSTSVVTNEQVVTALGMKKEDFKFEYLATGAGSSALRDGKVDAWAHIVGVPAPPHIEMARMPGGMKVISIPAAELEKVANKYPSAGYFVTKYPPNTIAGIDYEITGLASWLLVAVRDDFQEPLAYSIVKTLWENGNELRELYVTARDTSADSTAKFVPYKLHPGAEKYLKEKGLKK